MIDILVFFQWRGVLIFSYTQDPSEYINRAHSPALLAPRHGHITKLCPIGRKCKWWSKLQILPLKVRTLPSVSISSHGMGCGRGPSWSVEIRATPRNVRVTERGTLDPYFSQNGAAILAQRFETEKTHFISVTGILYLCFVLLNLWPKFSILRPWNLSKAFNIKITNILKTRKFYTPGIIPEIPLFYFENSLEKY